MDVRAGGGNQTSGGCAGKTHAIVNITEGSSGNHRYDWTMSGNKGSFGQGGSGKKYNGYNTSYSGYTDNYGAGGGGGGTAAVLLLKMAELVAVLATLVE